MAKKFFQFIPPGINYDFVGLRNRFAVISVTAVVLAFILIGVKGLNFGIDFSGGTEIQIAFRVCPKKGTKAAKTTKACIPASELTSNILRAKLHKQFPKMKPAIVPLGEDGTSFMLKFSQVSFLTKKQQTNLEAELKKAFPNPQDAKKSQLLNFDFRSEGGNKIDLIFSREIKGLKLKKKAKAKKAKAKKDKKAKAKKVAKISADIKSLTTIFARYDIKITKKNIVFAGRQGNEYSYTVVFGGLSAKLKEKLALMFKADTFEILQVEAVGPRVGKKLRNDGILSIIMANLFILIYIAIRFDFRYAPGAVAALIHDVTVTTGLFSILGVPFDLTIVAALLTIVGYSLNDTIVVFDRIRENWKRSRVDFGEIMNRSINETLSRTLLTSITTFLSVLPIYIIGGINIKWFAFAMMFGILIGTYSSIAIASPIVYWLDRVLNKRAKGDEEASAEKREKRRLRRSGLAS